MMVKKMGMGNGERRRREDDFPVSSRLFGESVYSVLSEICRYKKARKDFPGKSPNWNDQVRLMENPEIMGRIGK